LSLAVVNMSASITGWHVSSDNLAYNQATATLWLVGINNAYSTRYIVFYGAHVGCRSA